MDDGNDDDGTGYVKQYRLAKTDDDDKDHRWRWTVRQYLSNERRGSGFGGSLSVTSDGRRLIVGAPHDPGHDRYRSGAAYVYALVPQVTLLQSIMDGATAHALFGTRVRVSHDGSCVAVTACGAASVHVYRWDHGNDDYRVVGAPILQADPQDDDDYDYDVGHFGTSLSLSHDGSRLALGAPPPPPDNNNGDAGYRDHGHTFLFAIHDDHWRAIGKIAGEATGEQSGHSVAMTGDGGRVFVGAPTHDQEKDSSGCVRVYTSSGGL